jgi:hypothetical protein
VHTFIDVYELAGPGSAPYAAEQLGRWKEQHAGEDAPANPAELDEWQFKFALQRVATYAYPGNCVWPLLALTGDGHALAACYDTDTLYVLKLATPAPPGGDKAFALEPESLARSGAGKPVDFVVKPCGIAKIGAVAMDPSGAGVALLDRERNRVVTLRWPLTAAGNAECSSPAKVVNVPISW